MSEGERAAAEGVARRYARTGQPPRKTYACELCHQFHLAGTNGRLRHQRLYLRGLRHAASDELETG